MRPVSGPADRTALIGAFEGGRAAEDDAMATAAIALAALHQFGTPPGRAPGYVYEASASPPPSKVST